MTGHQSQPAGVGEHYAESSQATMVLVFGLLGLLLCQLFSPVAWVMGNKELAAIDAGRRPPNDRTMANIGRILGIVGTVIAISMVVAVVVLGIVLATSS